MQVSVAAVHERRVAKSEGHDGQMNAASLVKQIVGHLALTLVEDLDEPVQADITVRHVLSHTTGLPNWRPDGEDLVPLRPPGVQWGYSGEGFVLLQHHLERRSGRPIDELAQSLVFDPLEMRSSRIDEPEPGFHGYRPLLTTAVDYARFLAHVLTLDDERWRPQWRIDDELAWGAGWGLELGPPVSYPGDAATIKTIGTRENSPGTSHTGSSKRSSLKPFA